MPESPEGERQSNADWLLRHVMEAEGLDEAGAKAEIRRRGEEVRTKPPVGRAERLERIRRVRRQQARER